MNKIINNSKNKTHEYKNLIQNIAHLLGSGNFFFGEAAIIAAVVRLVSEPDIILFLVDDFSYFCFVQVLYIHNIYI